MRHSLEFPHTRRLRSLARVAVLACIAVASACQRRTASAENESTHVASRSLEVLATLKAKDMARLATFVHPTLGVRFSPSAHVRADADRVFSRAEIAALWNDAKTFTWGAADGTGDAFTLSFPAYYNRYVFGHDFTQAPKVAYTAAPIRTGNTPSNLAAMYPDARWIEYHFPGFDPKYEGMDWSSLWLVFQRERDEWFLVGVVHGRWSI
jgi:hypothetical protein